MLQVSRVPALFGLLFAFSTATGCGNRLGLELKGELDTANQSLGVGPGDSSDTGFNNDTNDTSDTNDSAGGSTSPATYRNVGFEVEDWRDVMWRTRRNRRSGL